MDAHQFTQHPVSLEVLARTTAAVLPYLPDRPLACVKDGCDEAAGFHSYTLPENLFIAWQRGGSSQYLELAKKYLHHAFFDPLARGEDVLPGGHAYGHALVLSSAAKAYLVLGKDRYLKAATNGFGFMEAPSSLHCLHERRDTDDLHRTFQVVSQHMETYLGTHARQCFGQEVRGSHPGFRREACGVRSRRFCIVSSTSSCSQRAMRRYGLLVHCALIGHLGQAEDQYLCIVRPCSTVVKRQMARWSAGHRYSSLAGI